MGGGVGLTIGFIFWLWVFSGLHTFLIFTLSLLIGLKGGASPRGFLGTLSQYMLSSAATYGTFKHQSVRAYQGKRICGFYHRFDPSIH